MAIQDSIGVGAASVAWDSYTASRARATNYSSHAQPSE